MAKIIKKHSALERECELWKNKGKSDLTKALVFFIIAIVLGAFCVLGAGLSLAFPVLSVVFVIIFFILAVCLIASVIFLIKVLYYYNRAKILALGIKGENRTADIIADLPEGYYGFQNLNITYQGKKSEIDLVVVGPTGIFVIETKNRNGHITGRYENKEWTQHKIGRGGTPYSSNFYNPVKQVGTHIYRLAHYLKENGALVHIDGAVYFSNPETTIEVGTAESAIPVFAAGKGGEKALKKFILSAQNRPSPNTLLKAYNLLLKL